MTYRWRIRRVNDGETDRRIIGDDGSLVDSINRFAREARVPLADPDHSLEAKYDDYDPVEVEYLDRSAGEWVRRFGGYVADLQKDDATLTVKCLSYDSFLRDRRVNRGYVDEPISAILEDLITDTAITPLDWDAGNVTVPNDESLDRVYEGEMLDVVLDELATAATDGEPAEWGANADAEFFFGPRGGQSTPSGALSPAIEVVDQDDQRTEKTRSTVYYGEDDDQTATTREDAAREGEIADKLPFDDADRATQPMSKHYPQIDDEDDADRKSKDLQSKHSAVDAWEFQTTGAGGVEPGMTGTLSVPHRDIDRTVRVAQVEYDLSGGLTTVLATANNRAALDRMVQIADEVSRLDARGQDSTADAKLVLSEDSEITIQSFGQVTKTGKLPPHEYDPPDATAVDIETSAYDEATSPYLAEVRLEDQATEQPVVIHEWGDV